MDRAKHIAIIGSGLIGRSWAMIFVSAGYKVEMYDNDEKQLAEALKDLERQLTIFEVKKILRGTMSSYEQLNLIEGTHSLEEAVANACFVQECIPENLDLKRELYEKIDKIIDDTTIISSSTSTFLPSVLSADLSHKSHFIVSHPVNPPYFVPLVEIVPAPYTTAEVVDFTFNLMKKVGQEPVKLNKEIPGFALNRIQYAILNECFSLVQDGVMNVTDVDKVMHEGLGMRYAFLGPLETAHLNANGFADYCSRYTESIYNVSKTFKELQKITGPTAEEISRQLNGSTPLNKLQDRRLWRDESLIRLSQLKKSNNMD